MKTMSESTAFNTDALQSKAPVQSVNRYYLYLSLWMWLLAIVGFGPGYVSALVDGSWIKSIPVHPLTDMLIFPTLFGMAVYFRRSPGIHKRLMVVATTFLLVAAVGRMTFLGEPPHPLVYDLVWLSPIWLAMIRDALLHRMLHPAYTISLILLAVVPFRTALVETAPYEHFTNLAGRARHLGLQQA
jgi:hypothetical protein